MNYYNENDPFAAQWLRNLIHENLIPQGHVDERSIVEVTAGDLDGYKQCHFFAGLAIWSLALRRAGWPDDRSVWTASCPCQPFSAVGRGGAFDDDRHLWPVFWRLAKKHRPAVCFGEQVASPDGLVWLDLVLADMEAEDYASTAFDLAAAGFGAPHIRQRLYWVGHTEHARLERHHRHEPAARGWQEQDRPDTSTGWLGGPWAGAQWLDFADGKKRPVQPGVSPLADVDPNRVGLLRAYGNAIVEEVAEQFVSAFMDVL